MFILLFGDGVGEDAGMTPNSARYYVLNDTCQELTPRSTIEAGRFTGSFEQK